MAAKTADGAFVLCKIRHNVALSPCHINEPRVGIEQDMTALLMQYSEKLQGVVLAFSKVELEKPAGHIVNEMPYIHCKVRADALVFRPQPGMRLQGTVNKIGSNHIGMLFGGVFNGSVAATEIPKGYVHNYHEDCWLAEDGSSIAVNDTVDVQVLKVHVAGGLVAVEATMRINSAKPASTKKVKADASEKVSKKRKHVAAPESVADEAEEVEVEQPKKKKDKTKKAKDSAKSKKKNKSK